jgi:pimeloyl-ACP methyl ester carboxylesterase
VKPGGPPVLLLHGQPGGAADWDGVIAELRGRADAIAVDRPGWDRTSRALDLEGNARAALAVLDAHGVRRATVAGHSLGAAIAAWLAATHPDRVAALVLAAPAANLASLYPFDRWLAAPLVAELASATMMGGLGLALSVPRLRRRIAAGAGVDPAYLTAARDGLLHRSAWRAYVSEQRTLIRDLPLLESRLGAITAPTTILTGSEDRVVPPMAARTLLGQIGGARLVQSERAGHLLPQRHPKLVADVIAAALNDQSGSTLGRA